MFSYNYNGKFEFELDGIELVEGGPIYFLAGNGKDVRDLKDRYTLVDAQVLDNGEWRDVAPESLPADWRETVESLEQNENEAAYERYLSDYYGGSGGTGLEGKSCDQIKQRCP